MDAIREFYPREYYTPMPEMHNENIPVTAGCNYNRCRYCDLNGLEKFRIFPLDKVKKYIHHKADFYQGQRRQPRKFTLLEGNALCADTDYLLEVMGEIHERFDQVDYISSFARSHDILRKSEEDLERLKAAGLDRLSIGIESGSNQVLSYQRKGITAENQLQALHKLDVLGIRYTCYIMLGLGGKQWSREHALETANFLNQVHPDELTIVTLVLFKGADLVADVRSGVFQRLSAQESIAEEKLLLENLTVDTIFNGTHPTNAVAMKGGIPIQKDLLLAKLDEVLATYDSAELQAREGQKWREIRG